MVDIRALEALALGCVGSSPTWGTMEKIVIEHKGYILKVNISEANTCILNSYKVKRVLDMINILHKIQCVAKSTDAINKRKVSGMVCEWRTHNLLYSLSVERDRTRSVDLDIGQPWYMKVAYTILSLFYPHI